MASRPRRLPGGTLDAPDRPPRLAARIVHTLFTPHPLRRHVAFTSRR